MFVLAGGLGALVAFLAGLAFASSARGVIVLGGIGAVLVSAYHAFLAAEGLDPMAAQLFQAAGDANALGWLAGTLLVARLRCLEWLEGLNAQEAT
jgi:hypothetical protein